MRSILPRVRFPAFLFASVLSAAALAPAQGATPEALIGGAVGPAVGPLIQHQTWCNPSRPLCAPILGAPPAANAGGTAYDPGRQIVWDSDGPTLIGVSATSTPPCQVICPPVPVNMLGVPAGSVVTGLAYDEVNSSLWILDSTPLLIQTTVGAAAPCPQPNMRCVLANVIPATHQTGGLAYSEKHKRLFYSASIFGAAGPANIVFSALVSSPCQPDCRLQVVGCTTIPALGPITGLAFDDCDDNLYLTDGAVVVRGIYTPPTPVAPCGLAQVQCCGAQLVARYYGLDIEASHPVNRGTSCTSPPCAACAAMALTAFGDPSLLNASFGLRVTEAPAPGIALFLLGLGPCTPGIPVFCGLYHPVFPPAPIVLGPVALAGGACAGTASLPLPVPLDVSLCGANICMQAGIICGAGGVGLTNAVDLRITDS